MLDFVLKEGDADGKRERQNDNNNVERVHVIAAIHGRTDKQNANRYGLQNKKKKRRRS